MNKIPNLDAMNETELREFWRKYERGRNRKDAAELIGDQRPGYTRFAALLANYADNKAVAIECRKRGDILAATNYETIADRIYDKLPGDLKW